MDRAQRKHVPSVKNEGNIVRLSLLNRNMHTETPSVLHVKSNLALGTIPVALGNRSIELARRPDGGAISRHGAPRDQHERRLDVLDVELKLVLLVRRVQGRRDAALP